MIKLFFLLCFSFPLYLLAQDCDCKLNFVSTVSQVTANYSGYSDKVKSLKDFKKFTSKLQQKAKITKSTDSCYVILNTWIGYFKDHHLRVQFPWRYREKYPDVVKRLNKLLLKTDGRPKAEEKLNDVTQIKQLSAETFLLRLPSFEWSEKKLIDSLIAIHKGQLQKTSNWIIDIRGNSGGIDYTYSSLLPFIYSNPVQVKPDEYRSSNGNIAILTENLNDKDLPESSKQFISNLIALMKANPNGYVNPSGKDFFEIKLDSIYPFPKKIAILMDRNSQSSAETFLLTAKQSNKVTLYGENTAGVIDYGSTQFFDLPCQDFDLVIPIARSKRLPQNPIDNIGIAPNINISPKEKDQVKVVEQMMENRTEC
ncbi:MAG: hypothetical protein EOO96_24160 [Pedobacter sp.]|nr:MAG: hypothetical protein EOO96_24160 [Pedobacter sp.]